ncbi:MAG: PEP-CTERM sorting domain-containing protein [Okeania sp. SIO2D1]|nr:PEP-CTERM sorting domain-containing protein [Okeania sp. SIO2D1]
MTENSTTQVTSTPVSNSQSIDLNSSTSEPVKEFTISNINPSIDWSEYPAFVTFDLYSELNSLWLEDNDDWLEDIDIIFTYTVELLAKSEGSPGKPIPEPSITFSLLALGILGLLKRQ